MPTPTLVVVDMQSTFAAANRPNLVASVAREVIQTKLNHGAVIFLEYVGCMPTHNGLLELVKGYPRRARLTKHDDDGSMEVVKCLKRRGFYDRRVRVCGVNTDCCVHATVQGLLDKLPNSQVDLIKDACDWARTNRFDWRTYPRHPNLMFV